MPLSKTNWNQEFNEYNPKEFTSEKIMLKDGKTYKDPHV